MAGSASPPPASPRPAPPRGTAPVASAAIIVAVVRSCRLAGRARAGRRGECGRLAWSPAALVDLRSGTLSPAGSSLPSPTVPERDPTPTSKSSPLYPCARSGRCALSGSGHPERGLGRRCHHQPGAAAARAGDPDLGPLVTLGRKFPRCHLSWGAAAFPRGGFLSGAAGWGSEGCGHFAAGSPALGARGGGRGFWPTRAVVLAAASLKLRGQRIPR